MRRKGYMEKKEVGEEKDTEENDTEEDDTDDGEENKMKINILSFFF